MDKLKIGIALYHDNCEKYPAEWIRFCVNSLSSQSVFFDKHFPHEIKFYALNYAAQPTYMLQADPIFGDAFKPVYRFSQQRNYADAMNYVYSWIFESCDIAVNVNIDDYYHYDRLRLLLSELPAYDIVSSNYIMIDETGKSLRRTDFAWLDVAAELERGNNIVSNPCHILKKKLFEKLKFDGNLVPVEDLYYWQQCVRAGFKIKIVPEFLHYYRVHAEQSGNKK